MNPVAPELYREFFDLTGSAPGGALFLVGRENRSHKCVLFPAERDRVEFIEARIPRPRSFVLSREEAEQALLDIIQSEAGADALYAYLQKHHSRTPTGFLRRTTK